MSGTQLNATPGAQYVAGGAAPAAAGNAEVAALDASRNILFVLGPDGVDALDADTLELRFGLASADVETPPGLTFGTGNSVAVYGDVLAVSFDGAERGESGGVVFYQLSGTGAGTTAEVLRVVTGPDFAVPDMVTFTPDGSKLLVAIEGEPTNDYSIDPRGGVAVIDVATGDVQFGGFAAFDTDALRAAGVRMNGLASPGDLPSTSLAEFDIEAEYITVNAAGTIAYVTLQEANAVGVFDIASASFTAVLPLGLKDHSQPGQEIDASDKDDAVNFANYPLFSYYMPDGIDSFEIDGRTFLVTANEGDGREYDALEDEVEVEDIDLDPSAFPDAAALQEVDALGSLNVSATEGDTDGDGDYDQLIAFGGRSITIWEVSADNSSITRVWDSGAQIDQFLAENAPDLFDDGRSDNKGAEPEHLALAEIDGELHAFVALERANGVMSFRIDTSGENPVGVLNGFFNSLGAAGEVDEAPEVFTYAPGEDGGPGTLYVPNEASGTVRKFDSGSSNAGSGNFTLQILHASDFEAGLLATDRAPNFAAIVDALEDTQANSITLSSGDNYIPGPFLAASTDSALRATLQSFYEGLLGLNPGTLTGLRESAARVDIAILNALGVQASVLGNHEFDLGPGVIADAADFIAGGGNGAGRVSSIGALFPYLSANLDFSGEPALAGLFTSALRDAASYGTTAADLATNEAILAEAADAQISPWTTIQEGGETIGVLGATTQILESISSTGGVEVIGDDENDMPELAAILQPYIDQMTAHGIDKIILLSHLQQNAFELELATLLRGVDVIIAGGSHEIFADETDPLRPGDAAAKSYPAFRTGADGKAVAVVNTGGEYSYVGRLVVTFDENGDIIPDSVDPAVSGAYVTTDAGVDAVAGNGDGTLSDDERDVIFADGTRGGEVKQLSDAVAGVIDAKDGNVFGYSDVFLDGRRAEVRTQETNLGNLTADASLSYARDFDPMVTVSMKNGGGIRAEIGAIVGQPIPEEVPPLANPDAGKLAGGVSQLDIENSLRFNNGLSVATFTADNLVKVVENALRGVAPGATPGAFPQVGGLVFSFDADSAPGDRVVSLAIRGEDGGLLDVLVQDGELVGDAARTFRVVTLNFLLDGGDGWMAGVTFTDRTDLFDPAGGNGFTTAGREQRALADYLAENHASPDQAFDLEDTEPSGDTRIQNLDERDDEVIPDATVTYYVGGSVGSIEAFVGTGPEGGTALIFTGSQRFESIVATAEDDIVAALGGHDSVFGEGGADSLVGGSGQDTIFGGEGADTLSGNTFADRLDGGEGDDVLAGDTGDDTAFGGGGLDTIEGGSGRDSLDGGAGDDELVGGSGADTILGMEGSDTLFGGTFADVLEGGDGADMLVGDTGGDTLTGGAGEDLFVFTGRRESSPFLTELQDIITDFVRGEDNLDFTSLDANDLVDGVQAFTLTGGTFGGNAPGLLRVVTVDATSVLVLANTDNDSGAEFGVLVRGMGTLDASDFILA